MLKKSALVALTLFSVSAFASGDVSANEHEKHEHKTAAKAPAKHTVKTPHGVEEPPADWVKKQDDFRRDFSE